MALEAEPAQRLERLPVGDAGRDDPEARPRRVDRDAVQVVGRGVPAGALHPDRADVALDRHVDRREQAGVGDVHVGRPVDREVGDDDRQPVGGDVDRARAVGDGGDDLQRRPQPAAAAHRDGVAAEVEGVLHVARVEDRQVQVEEGEVGARRHRRAGGAGVVADDHDRPAVARRAGVGAVADGVARPVEARRLAVPQADDPVTGRVGPPGRELAAHHRGRPELLVDVRSHDDLEARRVGGGPAQLPVEVAQRRALVARGEDGGVEPGRPVGAQLLDGEAGEGLEAGEEDGAGALGVAVRERVAARRGRAGSHRRDLPAAA